MALACTICNKYKGSDLASIDPINGEMVRLYHPRRDRWLDHFKLEKGEIIPLTAIGRVTVKLLPEKLGLKPRPLAERRATF